jgi:flagellar hook-basal body complex protein FliE
MMQPGIDPLAAVGTLQAAEPAFGAPQADAADAAAPGRFADMMRTKLDELNANFVSAEGTLRDLAAGKVVEPQEAMISMERARISVLTFIQLRNKLVESYQDVMRMQL